MRKLLYLLIMMLVVIRVYACKTDNDLEALRQEDMLKADTMKLKITIGDETATAVLYDNPTSRDFAAMLPITVKMEDYAGTEKICYPSRKLSTKGAPAGFDPSVGDIACYAPWGNIALFYKDFGYSSGLISMGKITSGMESFTVKGPIVVKIELVQ